MKLEKAIEILTLYMKPSDEIEPLDFDYAILLAIEAAKRLHLLRINFSDLPLRPLPGETKD